MQRNHCRNLVGGLVFLCFNAFIAYGEAKVSIQQPEPITTNLPIKSSDRQSLLKKSRWALFLDAGGGSLGRVAVNSSRDAVFTSQDHLVGKIGVDFFLFNSCQEKGMIACSDFLIRVAIGANYLFSSQLPAIAGIFGLEGNWFLGHQPYVALTLKAEVGYARLFPLDDQSSLPLEFRVSPNSMGTRDVILFSAGPGLLLNLGSLSNRLQGLGLSLDTTFYYFGGFGGFLVSPGFRYRF